MAELGALRRSRNPTVVVTANREVQTNEEAQVYDHDLDLFVTVQLLEDTLAVLSLGYFKEWVSSQRSRLTKKKEDNHMQNGQSRTSCRSRVIHLFRKRFVLNIDMTGSVVTRSS